VEWRLAVESAPKPPENLTAVVFLRTTSGKSVTELGEGPLPSNLDEYRAPGGAMDDVQRFFESHGFEVFPDGLGLTLFLKGSRALFAEHFGDSLDGSGEQLNVPEAVKVHVETIVLMRSAEYP
jgi:hypothetical protein